MGLCLNDCHAQVAQHAVDSALARLTRTDQSSQASLAEHSVKLAGQGASDCDSDRAAKAHRRKVRDKKASRGDSQGSKARSHKSDTESESPSSTDEGQ